MKIIALVCVAIVAVGCKKGSSDDCSTLFDKSSAMMKDMMPKGKSMADAKKEFLDQCHKEPAKFTGSPEGKCLLTAKDDAAAKACMEKALGDYTSKSKKSEAALQLNKLAKNLKVEYMTNAAFPKGKAATLPDTKKVEPMGGCCGETGGKCPVTDAWGKDSIWSVLDFQLDEPSLFRYSYESTDGQSFTATAVGDLDCDGTEITYTLTGTAKDGNVETNLVEPPANSD